MSRKNLTKKEIDNWKKQAVTAFHTEAFSGSFEKYWDMTIVLRMDMPVPYSEYWEDSRKVKLDAWNEEAAKHAEGK